MHATCTKCGKKKLASEFKPDKRKLNGLRSHCKECNYKDYVAWREKNPTYTALYLREWRAQHPGRAAESQRRWAAANLEKVHETSRRWREAHPEKQRAHGKVRQAVKTGRLVRPETCSKCGRPGRIQAHHDDYNKPLDVVWLCHPCHVAVDRRSVCR